MTRDEFILKNMPLVHSLANRFRGRGIEYEDLCAAGSLGLVKASDNFDESRGLCFSTYAVPVILGEMRRLFRDFGAVRISRSLKELSMRAAKVRDELCSQGIEPRISDIAQKLGITPEEAAEAISAALPPVSLTSPEDGGDIDIGSPEQPSVTMGEDAMIDKIALRQCLKELDEKDRLLLTLRFFRSKTQTETALILGMTQVQVSRRERKLLRELRALLV